jgi:hypothetical protein
MIEDMGFQVDPGLELDGFDVDEPEAVEFPLPGPPPTRPLPTPPISQKRSRPRSAMRQKPAPVSHTVAPASVPPRKFPPPRTSSLVSVHVPPTRFPPPAPPAKSPNRLSQLPPPVQLPQRRYSDEVSPRTVPRTGSPNKSLRPGSPVPRPISPRREPEPRRRTPEIPQVAPSERTTTTPVPSRKERQSETPVPDFFPTPFEFERCDTPAPDRNSISRVPTTSFYIERESTEPLKPKRRTLTRAASFKFGEGLQGYSLARTSSLLYTELSDALKELQRTIGAASVEVH